MITSFLNLMNEDWLRRPVLVAGGIGVGASGFLLGGILPWRDPGWLSRSLRDRLWRSRSAGFL